MRASTITRPAVVRLRPGIMDCESSSVNLTGHAVTLVRYTATGAPGESTDFATMKSVAPAAALARSGAASDTSPLSAVPAMEAAPPEPAVRGAPTLEAEASPDETGSGGNWCARAFAASSGRP